MSSRSITTILLMASLAGPCHSMPDSESDMITKQNQTEHKCLVKVDVGGKQDWMWFTITIPKDDRRLQRLQSVEFVVGKDGKPSPWQINIPVNVLTKEDGTKVFEVGVRESMIDNSFIQFTCSWPDPRLSSVDWCWLKLASYVENKNSK